MSAGLICELEYWIYYWMPAAAIVIDIIETAMHAAECAAIDAVLTGAI